MNSDPGNSKQSWSDSGMCSIKSLKRFSATLFAFLVSMSLALPLYAVPFSPFDEAGKDPEFERFRAEMVEIVESRDYKALKGKMHTEIIVSFGGDPGWEAAIGAMVREPERWKILGSILRKGGKFRMEGNNAGKKVKAFYAPYTFFAEIPGTDAIVVAERNVKVYAKPTARSRIMARLNNEVLEAVLSDRADNRTWFEVKLPNGKNGFVRAGEVSSSGDARAGFVKQDGEWKMHVFIGGDRIPAAAHALSPATSQPRGSLKPSFNCALAREDAEKAICSYPELAALDKVLAGV